MSNALEQSYNLLKKTIALLLKHRIAAIPINYTLWYNYVGNESRELNEQLDSLVAEDRPFSELQAKALYRDFLAEKEEVDAWELRQSLEAMIIELNNSITDTRTDANQFHQALDKGFEDLERIEQEGLTLDKIMNTVRSFIKESQNMRRSTLDFNNALSRAQEEIDTLKQELEQSKKDALYDALTGLHNRRFFDSDFAELRDNPDVCLIMVDIDHFKAVNDKYGHQMGDIVLKVVAKKLKECCHENANAYRFGGEEFAILMRNTQLRSALHLAEVMRHTIEKVNVMDRRRNIRLESVTASFGVAQNQPGDQRNDLIERADKLLYDAKQLGRNRVMPIKF
jgi:diguanylate cyclase